MPTTHPYNYTNILNLFYFLFATKTGFSSRIYRISYIYMVPHMGTQINHLPKSKMRATLEQYYSYKHSTESKPPNWSVFASRNFSIHFYRIINWISRSILQQNTHIYICTTYATTNRRSYIRSCGRMNARWSRSLHFNLQKHPGNGIYQLKQDKSEYCV